MEITRTHNIPSFTARIYLLNSKAEFIDRAKLFDHFYVGPTWTIDEAARSVPTAATTGIFNCVVTSVLDPVSRLVNMTHIQPREENMVNLAEIQQKTFNYVQELFKRSKSRLEGLITGGKMVDVAPAYYEYVHSPMLIAATKNTFNRISKLFGMDYSVIGLQKGWGNEINILTDGKNGIHYLLATDSNNKPITTPESLDKNFNFIQLSKADTVENANGDITEEVRKIQKNPFGSLIRQVWG